MAEKVDCFQSHLSSAKRHCLLSLLDYADVIKKSTKSDELKEALELMKKRIHNDIGQFHAMASNLIVLAKNGGEIPPFGENANDRQSGKRD
jgi:predicted DNA-binding ArsR family transcriptional regulator